MAEAAVEERTSPSRYYCHRCTIEFDQLAPGYTCPNCEGGFIEELAPVPETQPEENNEEMDVDPMVYLLNNHMGDLASLLFSGDHHHHHHNNYSTGENDPGQGASSRHQGRRSSRNRQQLPFENMLQDIIINLTSGWGGGTTTMTVGGAGGGGPMMFLGNPGDYAWGREGFDLIVTQLLNQMESSGPPPLESEQISSLPTVKITSEQTSIKLQCSVCWEDFKENESVRQLPCSHVYHDQCIFPWLQLHATCPICRKSLNTRDDSIRHNHIAGILQQISGGGPRIPTSDQQQTAHNNPSSTVQSSNASGSTETTQQQMNQNSEDGRANSRGPMRDYNMDLEFD